MIPLNPGESMKSRKASHLEPEHGNCGLWLDRWGCPLPFSILLMSYHVVALTMADVREGALGFQRELSTALTVAGDLRVYSASPFDLDERRRLKDRFGGDVVYFFNDAARDECRRLELDLKFVGEISEEELPKRRVLVVGRLDQGVKPEVVK
jgi:hypothetical protein